MDIHGLNWYIADRCIKADTNNGTYKVEQGPSGFIASYEPYVVSLSDGKSGFINDALQACEKHAFPEETIDSLPKDAESVSSTRVDWEDGSN